MRETVRALPRMSFHQLRLLRLIDFLYIIDSWGHLQLPRGFVSHMLLPAMSILRLKFVRAIIGSESLILEENMMAFVFSSCPSIFI